VKILLLSGRGDAASLMRSLLRADDHEITHCADGTHAVAELLGKKYDWAIMDGRAQRGGETDITRIIHAMGPYSDASRAMPADAGTTAHAVPSTAHAGCGVEWSKNGILQLHCRLHGMLRGAADACPREMNGVGDILFEFHAPCSKERGRT
jgi:CheY-like chemotaxis protein